MDKKNAYLIKNTIIIFFSKFCTQFLSFLILPLITSKLSTSEYGNFDLISTYGWLIVPYMSLQLENGMFRFLIDNRNNNNNQKKIITNGIITIFVQIIIFSLLYFPICILFNVNDYVFIYLYAISTLFLNIPLFISRGLGDNVNYGIASIITGTTNVITSFITVYFLGMKIDGLILALVASNLLGTLYLSIKKNIISKIKLSELNKKESKKLLKYSAPLVPNMTSAWIMNVSDKMMISIFINTAANGIYSICTKFPVLLSHVFSVFNVSWTETASINSKDSERDLFFSKTVDNLFKVCSCICLFILACMPILFKILIDNKFNEAYLFIPILLGASIFEAFSGILGGIYISLKLSKKISLSTLIAGLINLIVNLLFMKKFGIIVACISTAVSYLYLSIYRLIDIKKQIKLNLDVKIYIVTLILFIIITYQYYLRNDIICLVTVLIVVLYSYIMNIDLFRILLRKILKKKKRGYHGQ